LSWFDFHSIKRWMNKLVAKGKGSASTQRVFLCYFDRFCNFVRETPDQLIEERKLHLRSDDEFLRRKHEELAEKFSTVLRDREKASPNTVATAVAAVRSF